MWTIEITKSNKQEVKGVDYRRAQHTVDVSNLPTRPRIGDKIEGFKVPGSIIAERFLKAESDRNFQLRDRFALRKAFEPFVDADAPTYPIGLAFTISNYADDNSYNIVFDRDRNQRTGVQAYYKVSEYVLKQLTSDN